MKKHVLRLAVLLMGTAMFTACNDDNDTPQEYIVPVTKGAFLLCSGNYYGNIDGSLSYLDYTTGKVANGQFQAKNGRSLGGTPNDAMVYGSKLYIAVTDENTIEVLDAKTMQSLQQINTENLGDGCLKPRHITADGDKVYVSFYGKSTSSYDENWNTVTSGNGYVVAIDTVSFSRQALYEAGSFPEGIYVSDSKLYVCNSDYAACTKASISVIDLKTNASSQIKNDAVVNPQKIVLDTTGNMYILDFGNYGDKKSGVLRIAASSSTADRLMDANGMACVGNNIFGYYTENDAAWKPVKTTYEVYNLLTQSKSTYYTDDSNELIPSCIGADPVSGSIFIASYVLDSDTGYQAYTANGKLYMFDATYNQYGCFSTATKSSKVWGVEVGVGPVAFAYNVSADKITLYN